MVEHFIRTQQAPEVRLAVVEWYIVAAVAAV